MRTRWSLIALTSLALVQLSCAAGTLTPVQESMPAARAGLQPEYRLFYDALQDYGDWVLLEPYGYVFRPRSEMANWRPYADGYWAPSDSYGWVWISAESFGWATYHYGNWIYDKFQGWVWVPGLDWGPAWVSWEQTPDYVGWSPQFPVGYQGQASIPGGSYLYVPVSQLASTDLRAHVVDPSTVAQQAPQIEVVKNMEEREGVRFNRGPSIDVVERATGQPLPRVTLEDVGLGAKEGASKLAVPRRTEEPASAPAAESRTAAELVRQAAEKQAQEARAASEARSTPLPRLQIFRLLKPEREKPATTGGSHKPAKPAKKKAAPADSLRR